jgi:nucleotide-binding universal stress UspA family protein
VRILLCVDEDSALEAVLNALDELVETTTWDELVVFHVVANAPLLLAKKAKQPRDRVDEFLTGITARLSHLPVAIETRVASGNPAEAIVRAGERNEVDLIVIGARGQSRDFPVGSVSQKVVALADSDVLVVRQSEQPSDEPGSSERAFRALIPVDGSRASEAGITSFYRKLQAQRATIHLVHIVESLPSLWLVGSRNAEIAGPLAQHAEQVLARASSILAARGLEAQCEWHHGSPASQILDIARRRRCGLIVVGSQGHSRLGRLILGPMTNRILRYAPCSVLCARAWSHEWAALTSDWSSEGWEPQVGTA